MTAKILSLNQMLKRTVHVYATFEPSTYEIVHVLMTSHMTSTRDKESLQMRLKVTQGSRFAKQ